MKKSTFTEHYAVIRAKLVAMREAAGLTQRQLAQKLGKAHSIVAKLEMPRERRVDLAEFYWICLACGASPEKITAELIREMRAIDRGRKPR